MEKKFIHVIPDEPYSQSTRSNKTIECTYTGRRYLKVRVHNETKIADYVVLDSKEKQPLEDDVRNEEGFSYVILDAESNPWEAAYLTGMYEHGEVEDYKETLPTGEIYTFVWTDGTGILSQCHPANQLKYDASTNSYIRPAYFQFNMTKSVMQDSFDAEIREMEDVIQNSSKYTESQVAGAKEHLKWLKNAKTAYADVDPWKIPYKNPPELD